jgi:hypothetical protein
MNVSQEVRNQVMAQAQGDMALYVAFVAEPGEYALSYFDVKVARSIRQKD